METFGGGVSVFPDFVVSFVSVRSLISIVCFLFSLHHQTSEKFLPIQRLPLLLNAAFLKLQGDFQTSVLIYQFSNLFSVFLFSGRTLLERISPVSYHCYTPVNLSSFPHSLYHTLVWTLDLILLGLDVYFSTFM